MFDAGGRFVLKLGVFNLKILILALPVVGFAQTTSQLSASGTFSALTVNAVFAFTAFVARLESYMFWIVSTLVSASTKK